jgi:hypothetical protein
MTALRGAGRVVAISVLVASVLSGCGGSSSGSGGGSSSGSGSTTRYTKVVNDAAGELGQLSSQVPTTAHQYTALADRVHQIVVSLRGIKTPTAAGAPPLAAWTAAIAHYEKDLRAIAARGGTAGITPQLTSAIEADGTAMTNTQEKLVLY